MIRSAEKGESEGDAKRMAEIERLYDADLAKFNKLRRVLAQKNLEISKIMRQIDAIPTRAELIQYQRRFVELYELMQQKLVETRKYFALYNTFEEKHKYGSNRRVHTLNLPPHRKSAYIFLRARAWFFKHAHVFAVFHSCDCFQVHGE